jgi:beta-glucosidase
VNSSHGDRVSDRPAAEALDGQAPTDRPTRSPFPAADDVHVHSRGLPRTGMGWEVQPDGLRELLGRVHREYTGPAGVRLLVTENGAAYDDEVAPDGAVHDVERTEFLLAHLSAILDAIDEGTPVHGYFYWSILDNFEWAWGYDKRFGIVRVDYDTQERTVKDSGLAYARVIRDRALPAASGR